jgi:hypothetical protein
MVLGEGVITLFADYYVINYLYTHKITGAA